MCGTTGPKPPMISAVAAGGTLAHSGVSGHLVLLAVGALVLVAAGVFSVRAAHVRRGR